MSLFERVVWAVATVLFLIVVVILLTLGSFTPTLQALVADNLESSGVTHEVTAVLLNFRSLDTLLEVGVILLSLVAFYTVTPFYKHQPQRFESIVANSFTNLLFPLIAISAVYILWSGSFQSGGAFQAAALLGGGLIIIKLTQPQFFAKFNLYNLKALYSIGFFIFLLIGSFSMLDGKFLQYYEGFEYISILTIEAILTFSLGALLAAYFILCTQGLKQ